MICIDLLIIVKADVEMSEKLLNPKICEALNLPSMHELLVDTAEEVINEENETVDKMVAALSNTTSIQQLQDEEGVIEHCDEATTIYEEAMQAHRDLMDLAMNMEAKNAGSIAEPAAAFLKIALDASTNKTAAKFKKLRLKLDREKFEMAKNNNSNKNEVIDVTEESFTAQRNDLLKMLKDKNKK